MRELHYREWGTGDPLLLLHGLFGSCANLRGLAVCLGERFRVLAVDLRNHGRSAWGERMDYPAMAADLEDFLTRRRMDGVRLAGHSMGGKAAMWFALHWPRRCRSLAVLDVAPIDYGDRLSGLAQALQTLPVVELAGRHEADERLRSAIPERELRGFLLQNLVRTDAGLRWRINLPAIVRYLPQLQGFPEADGLAYRGPTLFLYGAESDYVQEEHRSVIFRLFPQARMEAVPAAAHWLHMQQPERVAVALLRFFSGAESM